MEWKKRKTQKLCYLRLLFFEMLNIYFIFIFYHFILCAVCVCVRTRDERTISERRKKNCFFFFGGMQTKWKKKCVKHLIFSTAGCLFSMSPCMSCAAWNEIIYRKYFNRNIIHRDNEKWVRHSIFMWQMEARENPQLGTSVPYSHVWWRHIYRSELRQTWSNFRMIVIAIILHTHIQWYTRGQSGGGRERARGREAAQILSLKLSSMMQNEERTKV